MSPLIDHEQFNIQLTLVVVNAALGFVHAKANLVIGGHVRLESQMGLNDQPSHHFMDENVIEVPRTVI